MAPHWTLALLLTISVLLGIGQAMTTCEADGTYQCVAEKHCTPSFEYRAIVPECQYNQICCANEDIHYDKPCGGEYECVYYDLCETKVGFRIAGQCPRGKTCCKIEKPNNLSIEELA